MWNIVRTLLFALALAGFFGQSAVYATPFQVFESTGGRAGMDCTEMMAMADEPTGRPFEPCDEMTPGCIAKIGCAAVAAPMPPAATVPRPFAPRGIRFDMIDVVREGAGPLPLKNPPKRLA